MKESAVITSIVSVLLAVTGLAIIAVLVSGNSKTTGVLSAGSGAISQAICTALSPVTGNSCSSLTDNVTHSINFG